jgi:hypothetical protein
MMSNTITIICLVQGHSAERAFPVHISKSSLVGDLKKEIKKENPNEFRNVDAKDLDLRKVNISSDDATIQQLTLEEIEATELRPTSKINKYFKELTDVPEDYIHVMVKPSARKCHFPLPLTQLIH